MNPSPAADTDPLADTGTADVRRVREQIAALYNGDIRRHVEETHALVEPMIEKLGLKYGVPKPNQERPPATDPVKTA